MANKSVVFREGVKPSYLREDIKPSYQGESIADTLSVFEEKSQVADSIKESLKQNFLNILSSGLISKLSGESFDKKDIENIPKNIGANLGGGYGVNLGINTPSPMWDFRDDYRVTFKKQFKNGGEVKGWGKGWDLTNTMKKYITNLKVEESAGGAELEAYSSLEGGADTIGYGHKIKEGEDFGGGLRDEKHAEEVLRKDVFESYKQSYNKFSNRLTEGGLSKKEADAKWNSLSDKDKVVLTELQFNTGNSEMMEDALSIFGSEVENKNSLLGALIAQRGYEDEQGNKVLLEQRNSRFINRYIEGQ